MEPPRDGGRRLAVAVVGSIGLAVLAGGLAGWIGYGSDSGADDRGFEALGRALAAVIAAVLVGVPVFVASVVVGVRRTVVAGRRLRTGAAIVVAAVAVPTLVGWVTETSRRSGFDLLSLPVVVVVVLAAASAIGGAAGTVPRRWGLGFGAGAVVALGLLAVALEVRGDEVADQRRASRYERNGAPLALIDGTDLDATFVGWELERVGGSSPGQVVVGYEIVDPEPEGYRWLELYFETDRDGIDCGAGSCEEVGRRPDGRPILGFRPADATAGSSGFSDLWVDVEGGRWRIGSTVRAVEPRSAVAVLEALEAVDADTFAAGT